MKRLSIEEKVGQMMLVGITNKECIEKVIELIEKKCIGGIILYKNNYNDYPDMINLIKKLKQANKKNKIPLFIAIDQEGGRVNRFPKEFNNIKNAYAFENADEQIIRDATIISGKLLNKSGINMNFAPVLDLKAQLDKHAIGNRAYSIDPKKVSIITNYIIEEYQKEKIVPVIKHFPGQGSVKRDSHVSLPLIKDYNKILENDIKPFTKAIKKGIEALMIGHVKIKGKTAGYPASISKDFIQNELRCRLNYQGMIITDELSMRSIRYKYGKNKSIIYAFLAGNDLISYKYYKGIEKTINKVINLVKNNAIDIEEINKSIERIIFTKKKMRISDSISIGNVSINKINKEIEAINEKLK